jgi:hypothetical protein
MALFVRACVHCCFKTGLCTLGKQSATCKTRSRFPLGEKCRRCGWQKEGKKVSSHVNCDRNANTANDSRRRRRRLGRKQTRENCCTFLLLPPEVLLHSSRTLFPFFIARVNSCPVASQFRPAAAQISNKISRPLSLKNEKENRTKTMSLISLLDRLLLFKFISTRKG